MIQAIQLGPRGREEESDTPQGTVVANGHPSGFRKDRVRDSATENEPPMALAKGGDQARGEKVR